MSRLSNLDWFYFNFVSYFWGFDYNRKTFWIMGESKNWSKKWESENLKNMMIELDPEIASVFKGSTSVSCKYLSIL